MTQQPQDALSIRPATVADARAFAESSPTPNGPRTAALVAAVQHSPAPALIEDQTGRPVALVGCIPIKDGNGAPWVELSAAVEDKTEALAAHLMEWTRVALLPRHALLFGSVPAGDNVRRNILEAAGFTFMEPIDGADSVPACIPCFMRAV